LRGTLPLKADYEVAAPPNYFLKRGEIILFSARSSESMGGMVLTPALAIPINQISNPIMIKNKTKKRTARGPK